MGICSSMYSTIFSQSFSSGSIDMMDAFTVSATTVHLLAYLLLRSSHSSSYRPSQLDEEPTKVLDFLSRCSYRYIPQNSSGIPELLIRPSKLVLNPLNLAMSQLNLGKSNGVIFAAL